MAFNTRPIKTDLNGKPIPQYYDPAIDDYRPLEGQHGAARSILYGPNGNPISAANRLPVDAAVSGTVDVSDRAERQLGQVTLSGRIEVLYEGAVSTITAGSSVAVVAKRPTEFKEVRGGIAVTFATRGDWRLYVVHMHASTGNNFGSEDLVRLSDDQLGGSGATNLLSSHFEVRVMNNNSFDAGVYRVSILGVR